MAFGDVFGGYLDAAQQHHTNILGMEYQRRAELARQYSDLAQSDKYPAEARSEFLRRALMIPQSDLGKKLPKDWEGMTVQVQPPTPPPVNIPGTPGAPAPTGQPTPGNAMGENAGIGAATASIAPRTVQPPTPPPQTRPVTQPYSPTETAQNTAAQSRITAPAQAEAEAGMARAQIPVETEAIQARAHTIQSLYPDMDPQMSAMLALKIPVAGMLGTTSVPDVPGSTIALPRDAFGAPIDHSAGALYTVEHNKQGQPVAAYPKENPVVGGLKFAQDQNTGRWVSYTTDRTGRVNIHEDLGLTPPQGVPTTSISHDIRIQGTPDGGFEEVPIAQSTTRTRGGAGAVAPPTPPPGTPAGTTAAPATTPAAPAAPTPPPGAGGAGGGTGGIKVIPGAGRALTPAQVIATSQKAESYSNTIDRLTGVLDKVDDPKFNFNSFLKRAKLDIVTNPNGVAKIVVSNAADLSPEEAKFAGDYASLGEDINVLRSVYNATGFRGPEALQVLLGQRGNLMGNPKVFKQVLTNSLQSIGSQMVPIQKALSRAGQPVALTDGILKYYLRMNGNDEKKALTALTKDGYKVD